MGSKYTRVRDKNTGHEYDVLAHRVDENRHELADQDRWPPVSHPRRPRHNIKGPRPDKKATSDATGSIYAAEPTATPDTSGDAPKPPRRRRRSPKTNTAG